MQFSWRFKFLKRLVIIYLIHLIIKGFDATFGNFFEFTLRGIVFSLFFISFWLIVWYGSEIVNSKLNSNKTYLKLFINILMGYSAAFVTNTIYRWGDIHLFNNSDPWNEVTFMNPEFTVSLLLLYILGYGINESSLSSLKIKEEQIKTEKLEKENILAQYKSLKAQIEPHFLFNSLSVLTSIINTNSELATEFVVKLSKTLRYIIEKNEFTLVPLKEELAVVNDYFFLIKIRFNQSIQFVNKIDQKIIDNSYIPPVSIQLLIENAVKHNKQTTDHPLCVELYNEKNYIIVKNNLNKLDVESNSTAIGLSNIKQRYELIGHKKVEIIETSQHFIVKLPILKKEQYDSFNH